MVDPPSDLLSLQAAFLIFFVWTGTQLTQSCEFLLDTLTYHLDCKKNKQTSKIKSSKM